MKRIILSSLLISLTAVLSCEKGSESFSSSTGSAKNGSMSRLITVGSFLYAVDDDRLKTIDASNPATMRITDDILLGSSIQT